MKYSLAVSILAGVAMAIPPQMMEIHKRQGFLGGLVGNLVNSGYGKVADVAGAAPRRQVLASRAAHLEGAKTVKVSSL